MDSGRDLHSVVYSEKEGYWESGLNVEVSFGITLKCSRQNISRNCLYFLKAIFHQYKGGF